jgi:hypothetical protein
LLVRARPPIARGEGISTESVSPSRPSQAEQLDKAPDAKNECDKTDDGHRKGIGKPILKSVEDVRSDEQPDHPPAAFVAVMEPLDRGGRQEPRAEHDDRSSFRVEQQGRVSVEAAPESPKVMLKATMSRKLR